MKTQPRSVVLFMISVFFMLGLPLLLVSLKGIASEKNGGDVKASLYIEFTTVNLKEGRELWIENCEGCHAYGIGDAPIPMEPDAWVKRIAKGKSVLYEHAINGFFGEDHSMMPERGGNLKLSDDEVKAAVDYMVALATYYIENQK